jgi:hypothetical protein
MAAQERQDHLTQSPSGNIEPARHLTSASGAGWQLLKWRQEQEREWEGHLRSLQQCIGELLIKNQRLRNPLPSTTNHRYREPDNKYDSNVARNRWS